MAGSGRGLSWRLLLIAPSCLLFVSSCVVPPLHLLRAPVGFAIRAGTGVLPGLLARPLARRLLPGVGRVRRIFLPRMRLLLEPVVLPVAQWPVAHRVVPASQWAHQGATGGMQVA
jgi:hypothetical protein